MNLSIKHIIPAALALAALAASPLAAAQDAEPIAVITTNAYSSTGANSSFTLRIGGNNLNTEAWIDVDGGDGIPVEYELTYADLVENEDGDQVWTYTAVSIPSLKDGQTVKVYGDPEQIAYFDIEGIYATSADISKLTKLDYLYASHNLLNDLDLTHNNQLQLIEVSDNPFEGDTSLLIGPKPELVFLEMAMINKVNPAFTLRDFPYLHTFSAYSNYGLYELDPTACPNLLQLSIDASNVASLDVSKNPNLLTLNVSDTPVNALDLSNNVNLQQLYISHGGSTHPEATFKAIDISPCTNLKIFSCSYNDIERLDVSKNTALMELFAQYNRLTSIDVSNCSDLYSLNLNNNYFTFATLPADRNTFYEYYYSEYPMKVDRSYAVDMPIDLSDKVLRDDGSETYARVLLSAAGSEVDESLYSYANGVISFNTVMPDSIYVEFGNNALPDYTQRTSNFVVKTSGEYGQPNKMATIGSMADTGVRVSLFLGVAGATPETPKQVLVDLGNGTPKAYTTTSATFDGTYTVNNARRDGSGYIVVYTPEGDDLTSIALADHQLASLDISAATSLRELRATGTGLYDIDLSANAMLETIVLDDNNLSTLNLANAAGLNDKMALKVLSAANNQIATTDLTDLNALQSLNLSGNALEALTLYAGEKLKDINLSNNKLTAIDLSTCYVAETINIENNDIVAFRLGTDNPITNFLCANNALTLQSLPEPSRFSGTYTYAPQATVAIPTIGPGFDLSEQYRVIDGNETRFRLMSHDGVPFTDGVDYSCDKGKIRFLDTALGMVYCEITHPSFPDFTGNNALRTTEIETAGMPTNLVATFTTTGDDTATMSLASNKPNSALYFDWRGTGVELEQYVLSTTYTIFTPYTYKGAEVKVYSYDEDPQISVFSILNAGISKFDGTNLSDCVTFTLANTGVGNDLTLPASPSLAELSLDGNNLSELDLSAYPKLRTLYLSGNQFTGGFDLSPYTQLEYASVAANGLTSVTLDNDKLISIDLGTNQLSDIDLSKCPSLEEANLSNNLLYSVDLDAAPKLKAVDISGNFFTLSTLPLPDDRFAVYYYGNQAPIDVACIDDAVNLSEYASVNGTATTYRWFVGMPTYDDVETYDLVGEELEPGTEFSVIDGVSYFAYPLEGLVCVMTNEVFPNLYFYTNPVDVTASAAIDAVADDAGRTPVAVYDLQGRLVATDTANLAPGFYIVRYSDGTSAKRRLR